MPRRNTRGPKKRNGRRKNKKRKPATERNPRKHGS